MGFYLDLPGATAAGFICGGALAAMGLVADLQRRGEPAQVLAAYEKAEPYAPRGQSRRRQIEALRSRLETHRDE